MNDAWLWAGTALAFSPALLELAAHWRAEPWARPSAVVLYLLLRAGSVLGRGATHRSVGLALLGAGLLLETLGLSAAPPAIGRVGLVLGLLGMALFVGRPPLRLALLLLVLVPVPFAVQRALDPLLRGPLESLAAGAASLLAAPSEATAQGIAQGERFVRIYEPELGVNGAVLLAATGWTIAALRGRSLGTGAAWAAIGAALGLLVEAKSLAAAACALAWIGEDAARSLVQHAPGIAAAALAVVGVELARPSRQPA